MSDYISWIRSRVGHDPVILNFAGCIIPDPEHRVLLQRRGDRESPVWGFPGGVAYSVTTFFVARDVGGELAADGVETLDVRYFDEGHLPELVNSQHRLAATNYFAGIRGAWT